MVKKKVKTENGYIAFDRDGQQLYEYRQNMGKGYYVTADPNGSYTYIDVDKKGNALKVEHHAANGERQYTRSLQKLDIKW